MRALVFLFSLLTVNPAFAAIAHQQVPASDLFRASARAFSLESINLIQTVHGAGGNCDAGDNPMICSGNGPIRGLVQVTAGYTSASGESVELLFNLPTSNFSQDQLREIAAGAPVDRYVTLSVKEIRKTVHQAAERCTFGDLTGSTKCEAPGRTATSTITVFDLAVSAR